MKMINLTIDGKKVSVPEGTYIVAAAEQAGIKIPTLCHRKELQPFTSCFICVVEIKGAPKLEPACSTLVSEGMEILTQSPEVMATRKLCLELLISEHDGDCLSPCRIECPAGCDAQGYVNAIAKNEFEQAAEIIKKTISLPSSIGRVCPRPCEKKCRRARKEGSLAICSLKRSAGDTVIDEPISISAFHKSGKKVAIIGAGPAGLNAAFFLRQLGHAVTIFEAKPQAGGMLQYGIPEYRLPKETLQKEIKNILDLGVDIQFGQNFGKDITIDSLKQNGFDAFLIAIGAQKAAAMQVDGEDQPGVISGIEFLEQVIRDQNYRVGKKVIVVGGGNTAIDAARTSLRLGSSVSILYRRTQKEMPAEPMEVHAALEEGVKIEFLTAPTKITRETDQLKITCVRMQLGEPDKSGRRRPVVVPNSEFDITADTIISAIGQKVDTSFLSSIGLELDSYFNVKADKVTCATNIPGIFAAGDCVLGPYIACAAIGLGRLAAISIDQYLKGEKVIGEEKPFSVEMGSLEDIPEEFYSPSPKASAQCDRDMREVKRYVMPELDVKKRIDNFKEVELGFSKADAQKEAARCLECSCRKEETCVLRELAASYKVDASRFAGARKSYHVDKSHPEIIFESNKCVLCGCCVRYCNEIAKQDVLGFVNRGFDTVVRPAFDKPLSSCKISFAKTLAEVCPTGAISLKE
jgi:formate dehydrogenase major subunit